MLEAIDSEKIATLARAAGAAIMEVYAQEVSIAYKEDRSPLTEADVKSHQIIVEGLRSFGLPILSEEGEHLTYEDRKAWTDFWLIDPLDGTKEFIHKNGEFTVNIAYIRHGVPVLGVVYAPALDDLYVATQGGGAFKNGQRLPLKVNTTPEKSLTVVASKSHLSEETQAFIDGLAQETASLGQLSKGSSLKLCMVAEGSADIYPRLGPTMEWDTAAADAIVRESGKMTYQYDGNLPWEAQEPLIYNKGNLRNPWFVVR